MTNHKLLNFYSKFQNNGHIFESIEQNFKLELVKVKIFSNIPITPFITMSHSLLLSL